jgi:hypothetical protein
LPIVVIAIDEAWDCERDHVNHNWESKNLRVNKREVNVGRSE